MKVDAHFDPETKKVGLVLVLDSEEAALLMAVVGPANSVAAKAYVDSSHDVRKIYVENGIKIYDKKPEALARFLNTLLLKLWEPLYDKAQEEEERDANADPSKKVEDDF